MPKAPTFKHITNYSQDESSATMLIYRQIGDSVDENGRYVYGIDGASFASEMLWLAHNGIKTLNIRINSGGGSVIEGYSILSAILSFPGEVNTFIDGLAASTAGWIALAGKKVSMMDFAILMMHPASGADDKVLDAINASIATILTNRSKKTSEEITKMMGEETWMDALTAFTAGFVDDVISSEKVVPVNKSTPVSELVNIFNSVLNPENNMKKLVILAGLFNLVTEGKSEDLLSAEVDGAIKNLQKENKDLKAENEALKKEKSDAEAAAKVKADADATEMITNAITGKLISEEEKETYLELAKSNPTLAKNVISKLKPSTTPVADITKGIDNSAAGADDEKALAAEYEKLSKENPKKLMEIKNSDSARFEKMVRAYANTAKK